MEKLPTHIGKEAAAAVAAATGVSADAVGLALSELIPNIIAKPLELDASAGVFGAQMTEIERSLRAVCARGQDQPEEGQPPEQKVQAAVPGGRLGEEDPAEQESKSEPEPGSQGTLVLDFSLQFAFAPAGLKMVCIVAAADAASANP